MKNKSILPGPNIAPTPTDRRDLRDWRMAKTPEYMRYLKCKAGDASRSKRVKVTLPQFNCLTPDLKED